MLTSKLLLTEQFQMLTGNEASPRLGQWSSKLILTEQVQMLTSKPLAGSVKKQVIVLTEQSGQIWWQCSVSWNVSSSRRQSAPHIQLLRPVGFQQPKSVSHLMAMLCFIWHTSKKETSSVYPSIRLCLMAIALRSGDWQILAGYGGLTNRTVRWNWALPSGDLEILVPQNLKDQNFPAGAEIVKFFFYFSLLVKFDRLILPSQVKKFNSKQ